MKAEKDFYESLLDNLYDGVYFLDHDRKITCWNLSAKRLTGYRVSEVMGLCCDDNIMKHVDDKGLALCRDSLCPTKRTLDDGQEREEKLFLHHKEGHRVPVSIRVAPIHGLVRDIVGVVEVFSDNTSSVEAKQTIEELSKMALPDPLTQVGNRRFSKTNIIARLNALSRYGWPFGVLFIDIDDFKDINDLYGHYTCDQDLKMLGRTLDNSIRSLDLICRWGGEEFLTIIANVDEEGLYAVSEKLRAMMQKSSITPDSEKVSVTVSLGATIARTGDTLEGLVNRADRLMHESKSADRNRVTLD